MAGLPWRLVERLADGQCHSGQALGDYLGVSRAAIWKMVQQLEAAGLPVTSVRGQGYHVEGGIDLLDADAIGATLSPLVASLLGGLQVLQQIDSTNSYLLKGDFGLGEVVLAEQQTAGRGRRGREWVSPLASNVYLSVRWHFSAGMASLEGLSLAVGVVIAEALESLGVQGVELKWPNDVWVQGRKLAGVLVEAGGDVSGECFAVVGVGINVKMPSNLDAAINQPWIDLAELGFSAGRNRLASELISGLVGLLANYEQVGLRVYAPRWEARNALKGRQVATQGAVALTGVVAGISPVGGLLIQTAAGVKEIVGGEVSVRASEA